jgi:hypothetical protein
MVEPAKQKSMVVAFQRDATGGNGLVKKKMVLVGPGLPADSSNALPKNIHIHFFQLQA